jgi:hypothetical protein
MSGNPNPWLRPVILALLLLVLALLLMASRWQTSDARFTGQKANPGNSLRAAQSF